ncbi:MAG: hypothetical protein HY910_08980 [Desulfarculus sp.]|nr:hypothetical protein [Desulfarculus sp.]
MAPTPESLEARLALVDGILEGAFFSPLHQHDWLAFCCGQPALLGLEQDEMQDLFLRAALTCQTIYPELVEGRSPLAWLWAMDDPRPVLAQVLVSLRHDRPLLFHRVLFSLPAVAQGQVNPDDFELAEDFLTQALGEGLDLRQAAAEEMETIGRRALKAAGQDPDQPDPRLAALAGQVLEEALAHDLGSDHALRLWLVAGPGLAGVDERLAPAVLVEAWRRWVGAVSGARPDLGLLERWLPLLGLGEADLALHAPVDPHGGHVIAAQCPYCAALISLRLGVKVEKLSGCPHLVYVGTGDEVHLLEVLSHFDLGSDFKALLASYYQSPSDLELYGTIVNDLYEMLAHQGRLRAIPVRSESAPQAFYNLRAYFAGPSAPGPTHH